MIHDPLCKGYFLQFGGGESCNCDLIAKVREDEATQWANGVDQWIDGVQLNSYRRALREAAETILSLNIWNPSLPEDYGFNSGLAKAIKAVHRLSGEQQ